jgi:hypothetical protein
MRASQCCAGRTAILAASLFVGQSEAAPAKAISIIHYSLLLALITAALICSSLLAQDKAGLQANASVLSILQGNA